MKRSLLLLFYCLLFLAPDTQAQKIRFTDTSNVWITKYSSGWPYSESFEESFFSGDTILNGKQYEVEYNKAKWGTFKNGHYYRDDTVANAVFIVMGTDTFERKLYDYNLKLNDTFNILYTPLSSGKDSAIVDRIDSILIRSTWHKKWHLKGIAGGIINSEIIEGIGLRYWHAFEQAVDLVCFRNSTIVPDSTGGVVSSGSCKLSVQSTNKQSQSITIIPNPANENSKIVFPYAIQQGRLVVTNAMGQVVLQNEFQQKDKIELGALPAERLYFYTVIDVQNSATFTGKFVYE